MLWSESVFCALELGQCRYGRRVGCFTCTSYDAVIDVSKRRGLSHKGTHFQKIGLKAIEAAATGCGQKSLTELHFTYCTVS